jgi:Tfp pilus assembly protein PilN
MTAVIPETEVGIDPLSLAPVADVPVPHVNLLPPEILERRALRRLAHVLVAAVLAAVAVGGVVGYQGGSGAGEAQASLDAATAQQSRLQAQVNALSPAAAALSDAQATQASLRAALANEVLWSTYLDRLRLTLPEGVRFSSVQITPSEGAEAAPGGTAGAATPPRPVNTTAAQAESGTGSAGATGIAAMTLNGVGVSQDAVADLLQSLATVPQFSNVYLTSSTSDGAGEGSALVDFAVTLDVTSSALSHRYDANGG